VLLFDPLCCLLSTVKAVVAARRRPGGQDGECRAAGPAQSAPNADNIMDLVVGLLSPLPMANDGLVAAQRTPPRQHPQRERGHPGVDLVFRFWQCDKENHGWREGLPLTVSAKFRSRGPAFTLR